MIKQWKQIPCGHARINRELEEIAPETCSSSDSTIARYVFDKNYEVSIPDRSDWLVNNVVLNVVKQTFVQEQVSSLNHTTSNKMYHFQAEVYAIRNCVSYLCDEVNAYARIAYAALKALAALRPLHTWFSKP